MVAGWEVGGGGKIGPKFCGHSPNEDLKQDMMTFLNSLIFSGRGFLRLGHCSCEVWLGSPLRMSKFILSPAAFVISLTQDTRRYRRTLLILFNTWGFWTLLTTPFMMKESFSLTIDSTHGLLIFILIEREKFCSQMNWT